MVAIQTFSFFEGGGLVHQLLLVHLRDGIVKTRFDSIWLLYCGNRCHYFRLVFNFFSSVHFSGSRLAPLCCVELLGVHFVLIDERSWLLCWRRGFARLVKEVALHDARLPFRV